MTTEREPVLEVAHLSFAYPGEPPLVTDWSAHIAAGVTVLQGNTGSGKSTLLRLLAGDLPASLGALSLCGVALASDGAAYRRQVFWRDPAEPDDDTLTPAQIVASLRSAQPNFDEAAWLHHLDGFALAPHLGKPLYAMSTGSRRKVGLSAALAAGYALTLLDEPTAGLDAPSIAHLAKALTLASERGIVIVAGGDIEALRFAGLIELPLR